MWVVPVSASGGLRAAHNIMALHKTAGITQRCDLSVCLFVCLSYAISSENVRCFVISGLKYTWSKKFVVNISKPSERDRTIINTEHE